MSDRSFPADIRRLKVQVGGDEGFTHTFIGRDAWALARLIEAKEQGCTPISRPAPRWSHYIHKIRKAGVVVETVDEPHGGAYSGHHARYILRSSVEVLEETRH